MISLRNLGLLYSAASSRNLSSFKSALSLRNLYPNSSFTTPVKIPENDKFNGFIPTEKLQISYSKSTGPGGQHINTTNTKVDVRFHVESADWLSHEIRESILQKLKNRINKDGFLIVRSDKTRSQIYNQADAMTILRELIRSVIVKPPTGPSEETVHMLRKSKKMVPHTAILQLQYMCPTFSKLRHLIEEEEEGVERSGVIFSVNASLGNTRNC